MESNRNTQLDLLYYAVILLNGTLMFCFDKSIHLTHYKSRLPSYTTGLLPSSPLRMPTISTKAIMVY